MTTKCLLICIGHLLTYSFLIIIISSALNENEFLYVLGPGVLYRWPTQIVIQVDYKFTIYD